MTPIDRSDIDEGEKMRSAQQMIEARHWDDAKQVIYLLARHDPANRKYRALLALVLGYEAEEQGLHTRARSEFRRAVMLDPSLRLRPGVRKRARTSLVERLLGRA
jgi:Tfp pilus assembly protein PilF